MWTLAGTASSEILILRSVLLDQGVILVPAGALLGDIGGPWEPFWETLGGLGSADGHFFCILSLLLDDFCDAALQVQSQISFQELWALF